MKVLHYLHLTLADKFYRWAMREIRPTHPDVPKIMIRQSEIRDGLARIFQ